MLACSWSEGENNFTVDFFEFSVLMNYRLLSFYSLKAQFSSNMLSMVGDNQQLRKEKFHFFFSDGYEYGLSFRANLYCPLKPSFFSSLTLVCDLFLFLNKIKLFKKICLIQRVVFLLLFLTSDMFQRDFVLASTNLHTCLNPTGKNSYPFNDDFSFQIAKTSIEEINQEINNKVCWELFQQVKKCRSNRK